MNLKTLALAGVALTVWAANLWAQSPPTITIQPTNLAIMAGGTATFSVAVSGTEPFTYQWQLNGTNLPNGIITTMAGNGSWVFSGDGGAATNASLAPLGVSVDASGNLYIADSGNSRIRKVNPSGIITTVAGNGIWNFSGDDGAATNASLYYPAGVSVDTSGDLFIADEWNNCIRKVDTNSIITTVAGNVNCDNCGYSGDGGLAINASLGGPSCVAMDTSGNLFIADSENCRVRKVNPSGIITTVAGNGVFGDYSGDGGAATNASLYYPVGVAVDASGNLFIADKNSNRILKVAPNGIITTAAGDGPSGPFTGNYSGDGGAATNASLHAPAGVAVDAFGNLFIADEDNNRIRKVDTNGIITTVAGNGPSGGPGSYSGDGGAATNANLYAPAGVAVDASGNLYIADSGNNRIREVALFASYPTLRLCNVTTNNVGNYAVIITSPYGSITSSIVTLTVVDVNIMAQPQSLIVTNGSLASFSGSVSGTGPFNYQWQKNGTNLFDSGNLSGSATTNLLLSSTIANDAGNYTFIITCPYASGSVTSRVASLAVMLPPEPANQTVIRGDTATFSVAVSGPGPFTYQWRWNGTNLPNGIIKTVAGNGSPGYSGDGGAATNASLYYPAGVAVDGSGNLFIADYHNSYIRTVDPNGIIKTVAGNGIPSYSGDGGAATNARLYYPAGVAVDASGNLFIADQNNNRIRKVDTNGIITTEAGYGTSGGPGSYSGDGGAATYASLYHPAGVTVDASGNLFIADQNNNRIRKMDTNGIITTVAGDGPSSPSTGSFSGDSGAATNASLYAPAGVAVDASGNLFIADRNNNRIRKVDTNGIITTVVGNGSPGYSGDSGAATYASLYHPSGLAVDASGNLFIADYNNNRIRKVDPNGTITTVAGNGSASYSGDGGAATNASLHSPSGVVVDTSGNLFIADYSNERIREVALFASHPILILNNVTTNNAGNYTVIVTSPYGSVTSSIITLTVVDVNIMAQPQSLIVTNGSLTSFRVSVSGTGPFNYQWQKNCTNLFDGGNISGSATTNLVFTNANSNDAGNYTFIITCPYASGSVTSRVASLAVMLPPEPTNQTVISGGMATFSMEVFGPGPFTYQWRLNGTNLPNGIIKTVAGNGIPSYSGDGGAATNASLHSPYGAVVDASGNLFIADYYNSCIRKVDPNGIITTVAGNGSQGYSGDGGAATNASLSNPCGVAVDAPGNLFIADFNNTIRKVDPTGIITTVAGNDSSGYSGDGGAATNASLCYPAGVAVDTTGNLFIADCYNNRIRKVDTNGIITTVAGDGPSDDPFPGGGSYSGDGGAATNANLNWPIGVAVDASGNLFIADGFNGRVRKVDTTGIITTVAGNDIDIPGGSGDGGAATCASLDGPSGVAVDATGNLFIADRFNSRIRKVNPNGIITTVAGKGSQGYSGDGGAATNARLYYPAGVAVDASGNLFIADTSNQRIREVMLFSCPTLTFNNIITNNAGNYTVIVTSPYGSITSSIVTLTVVVRPAISGLVPNLDGSATLSFSGGAGETYLVEAATNLMPPVVWQTVSTNVAGADGTWQFTDPGATNCPMRLYRAHTP